MRLSEHTYRTVSSIRGPLIFLDRVRQVRFGEVVRIIPPEGKPLEGEVIKIDGDTVLVQVLGETRGMDTGSAVIFSDAVKRAPLSPEVVGRVFSGSFAPLDNEPPYIPERWGAISGAPMNPVARARPQDFIETGFSTIDALNTLVRGQKLPIFSGGGLPHNRVAAQIVRQAKLLGEEAAEFVVVFAAFGASHADARFFQESFEESGVLNKVVMFLNLADEPVIERLLTPRAALTAAEFLAFDLDYHVLVVMTDMTAYAEALREVAVLRGDVPARKGYPGYLYSDLAEIYERAGRIKNRRGSITMIPVLSMPSDDITHPIPDLTGYITEGQIVLGRELANQGVYPPVTVLPSLSRLMKDGVGKHFTREDHPHVASQLFASYAKALEVRGLAAIIGAEELSDADRRTLAFADAFERRFIGQGEDEDRSVHETLNLAWELLSMLPPESLIRVSEDELAKYHKASGESRAESGE